MTGASFRLTIEAFLKRFSDVGVDGELFSDPSLYLKSLHFRSLFIGEVSFRHCLKLEWTFIILNINYTVVDTGYDRCL